MFPTLKRLALLLALAAGLPACATITSGTSQSISVITEPAGASCSLTREGATVGVVNPTPGTITIGKSSRDLAIRCTRAGSLPGVATAPAEFQPMTVGNLLFGGLIGLGVDAASGAIARYAENVTVTLPPEPAPPGIPTDSLLQRALDARRLYDERIQAERSGCDAGRRSTCEARIRDLIRERDEEVGRLDQQRRGASSML